MSAYDPANLKGAIDPTLKYAPFRQNFTVTQVIFDTLLMFNKLYKRAVIYNNDATNNATFRKESGAPLITIPPASYAEILEWGSYLEINPTAVTGTGLVEFDLVSQEDAKS